MTVDDDQEDLSGEPNEDEDDADRNQEASFSADDHGESQPSTTII